MINKKFGRLLVLKRIGSDNNGAIVYKCKCDCGNIKNTRGYCLRNGSTQSCGCLNKERVSLSRRKGIETVYNDLYSRYKKSAQYSNRSFSLSFIFFKKLISSNCNYCGIEPFNIHNKYKTQKGKLRTTTRQYTKEYANSMEIKYNGIDRVNNKKGYIKNNVVTCCKICNRAKMNLTSNEFNNWLNRIKGQI